MLNKPERWRTQWGRKTPAEILRAVVARIDAADPHDGGQVGGVEWPLLYRTRDDIAWVLAELEREEAEIARRARNLLAVIHRDGGHHTAKVGFIQSCKDAEGEVIKLRSRKE